MKLGQFGPKAIESIAESTARTNLWHGAVRSGKTVASIIRWLQYVARAPEGDLLLIGKTERALKRNILDVIEGIVGKKAYHLNRGTGEAHIFGRRCYLAGANDERAEGKIRGLTLAGAYGDEITLWPQSIWDMLGTRLSVPGAKAFGTTNPDGPFHWLKQETIDRAGSLDVRCWHFGLDDNPNLDPAFVAHLKTQYTGLFYRRFILGEWCLAEGVVYDGFDLDRHGFDDDDTPLAFDYLFVSLDYGTQNPFHALLIGVLDGVAYVLDEWRYCGREALHQLTDAEYSEAVCDWFGPYGPDCVVVDPSATSFIAQLRKDLPRRSRVRHADNEVLEGIRYTAGLLENGRLKVHRTRCPHLVRELAVYSWDPKAAKKGEDKPLKRDDHGPDALRYACNTVLKGMGTGGMSATIVRR